jgi:aldose 1-epimerase
MLLCLAATASLGWSLAYGQTPAGAQKGSPEVKAFGKTSAGVETQLYILKNKHGIEAAITNYGATLVWLKTPDREGKLADIVLGFDDVASYEKGSPYFGATIGRYGNRIGKAQFTLNGETYHLAANNGANTLHGGKKGFDKVIWKAVPLTSQSVEFAYTSKDGEEGYPGTLHVTVRYTLTETDELRLEYRAVLDPGKDTVVNLTNHSYFNLSGDPTTSIEDHQLTIYASSYNPTDAGQIPTGEIAPVKGTPFDFTKATVIGARIGQDDAQLKVGGGYDHNWILDRKSAAGLAKVAEVYDPKSGRVLDIESTEPAVQFYSGNNLKGTTTGKGGKVYPHRAALCLETQHYPDSPNEPKFPTTTLKAGHTYTSTTVWKFSARK